VELSTAVTVVFPACGSPASQKTLGFGVKLGGCGWYKQALLGSGAWQRDCAHNADL
jgi:hypothetical protein